MAQLVACGAYHEGTKGMLVSHRISVSVVGSVQRRSMLNSLHMQASSHQRGIKGAKILVKGEGHGARVY